MSALGDALLDAWGGTGRRRSYDAKGWHAQVTKLTESQRGYDAMARAGIDVTPATLLTWLSRDGRDTDFAPSAGNRAKIRQAYDIMAGSWDTANERRPYLISGMVKMGADIRNRGHRSAPLKVEAVPARHWANIRAEWDAGTLTSDDAEDLFTDDVIGNDPALASTSEPWEFPGDHYTIT